MDIVRKKTDSFWSESLNLTNQQSVIAERDLQKIFCQQKRRLNFKRVLFFTSLFFVIWLVVLVFSAPNALKSIAYANSGVNYLRSGADQLIDNPKNAQRMFLASSQSFQRAGETMRSMSLSAKILLAVPQAKNSLHLMRAGNYLAAVGANLTEVLDYQADKKPLTGGVEALISQRLTATDDLLKEKESSINQTILNLNQATEELEQIEIGQLPRSYQKFVSDWKETVISLTKKANAIAQLIRRRELILGHSNQAKKYLILFQNDTELRPTGGFLGSYATLTFEGAEVKEWWVQKNIYKQDKAFEANHKIDPPIPLQRLTKTWALKDSNWAVDFPEAAKEVANFYQLEGGTKVDGVIAINTTIVEDLLKLTGPIQVPGYDFAIDANNFVSQTQKQVELDYYQNPDNIKENEPKTYLADLSEILVQALNTIPNDKKSGLSKIFTHGLKEKNILFSLFDQNLGQNLKDLEIDGQVQKPAGDYLYLVNANLGGKKSSRNVQQEANLQTYLKKDGSAEHILTVKRTHHGDGTWPDGDNKNLLKILIPNGSQLLDYSWQNNSDSDNQIKVLSEAGQTEFEIWFETPVGQEKTLTVRYQTPKVVNDNIYQIYHQKQPGAQNLRLTQTINVDKKIKKTVGLPNLKQTATTLTTSFDQNQDYKLRVEF